MLLDGAMVSGVVSPSPLKLVLSMMSSVYTHTHTASIVSVLLQHGAQTNKINRRREIPHQCAQSRKVTTYVVPINSTVHVLSQEVLVIYIWYVIF